MKTLVVLSALAAVALAAPTLHEQGSEDFKKLTNIHNTLKRERKSLLESSESDPAIGAPVILPSTSHVTEFGVSGRSFGLKKPIIIKKKPLGYQVYRDSDEVPAESGETCGSQVKVKFCDGKTELKSSTIEDAATQMTDEDVKHSITLAKEAIENLQKDLNTVEQKPSTQESTWNHGHSESDAELHQDIENAREALEHIHNNFGKLESMSLHTETIPEAQFTIAKTEEERLAQWKEAIDTIQKNVEIAKNIEDSFRVAPDVDGESLISDDMIENDKQDLSKKMDHNLRTLEDKPESKPETESCKTDQVHEKSSENENIKKVPVQEDDMASSASTISEKEIKEDPTMGQSSQILTDTETNLPPTTEKSIEDTPKEKDADIDSMVTKDLLEKIIVPNTMKSVEENKEEKEKEILIEGADNKDAPTQSMKSVETEDILTENQKKSAVSTESSENLNIKNLPENKSSELLDTNDQINNEDKVQADLDTEQSKQIDTTLFARSAEEDTMKPQEESLDDTKMNNNMANEPEKHLSELKMTNNVGWKTKQAMPPTTADIDAEHIQVQEHQALLHPEMRSDDLKNMHQQLMMTPKTRWAEDKNMQLHREAMASAAGVHPHMLQHPGHIHHVGHGMKNQHFAMPNSQGFQTRFPEHFMTEEKSADQDMQAYYMNMRDGSGLAPEEQRFRWKPAHEGSRSAYGAPAVPAAPLGGGSSGSALGVFPNAHLGGCGIPLLLSCNPSVVSGSLANPSSGPFGAPGPAPGPGPAYRTEDDFTFHMKRDVKQAHENLSSNLHRSPKTNLKTSTVLVAKQ